jgi:NAD(P)-dependent dehydrogenase (short-subunit alcohol dehydrogenase family)
MKLTGKVALITGGGRGLGRAIALAYAREGADVIVTARTAAEIAHVAAAVQGLGGRALARSCDVGDAEAITGLAEEVVATFGRIDVLVNNAGILTPTAPLLDVPVADWDEVMRVNLRGPFLCCKAVVPHMMARRRGSVINVSSGLGRGSSPHYGPYAASKWGLEGLTKALAAEVQRAGVRVNSVSPGMLATQMTGFIGGKPESVTPLFVYLASDASERVTGQALDAQEWRERR